MKQRWGIAIHKSNQLALVGEAIAIIHPYRNSQEWASRSYYNLYNHDIIPSCPYLLYAFIDYFYLWDNKNLKIEEDKQMIIPNYSADAKIILNPYYERINKQPETLNNYGLEIIVSSWLIDIISKTINLNETPEYQDLLINSGLYESIVGGYLNYEVAA